MSGPPYQDYCARVTAWDATTFVKNAANEVRIGAMVRLRGVGVRGRPGGGGALLLDLRVQDGGQIEVLAPDHPSLKATMRCAVCKMRTGPWGCGTHRGRKIERM